jgi:threonine-phosphate decarboxylase
MTKTFDHGGTVFATARSLGIDVGELVDFSASINPLGPPPGVRERVAAAFDRLVHYPDSDGTLLSGLLAQRHGVAPDCLCLGNGSTELIYLIPRLAAGSRALLIAPTFSEYGRALHLAGWQCDRHYLSASTRFALDLDLLATDLDRGYDLLFLCNPGNPTGRLYGRDEVAGVIGLCREHGTLLVLDEAFMDFCEEESAKDLVVDGGAGVVLRSMTKFYGFPGLRLGYALAEPELAARLAALRPPWSVNTLAQEAGLAALADPDYTERTREYVERERERLADGLAELRGVTVYPGAANYLLAELNGGMTAAELQRALLARRLLIRDCAGFAGLDDRFFRVAVRTGRENELLLAALGDVLGSGR